MNRGTISLLNSVLYAMSKIFSAIKSRAPQGPGGPHAMGESHSFWSARPKDDPREIYNWKIYVVTCVSCMGEYAPLWLVDL